MTEKVVCNEFRCGWYGTSDAILRAPSPFDPNNMMLACPRCKTVAAVMIACDEPGCWQQATCGTPVANGYRRTCGKHIPKVAK